MPIGQDRRVLRTGPDPVPPWHSTPIDRSGGYAIAMVDLFELHPALGKHLLDGCCVRDRVVEQQQAGLQPDTTRATSPCRVAAPTW
jgi:hypothetical protein